MKNIEDMLDDVLDRYLELPHDARRLELNAQAVKLADQAKDSYWMLVTRADYAFEIVASGDAPKALPVCAEFDALLKQYPDVLESREETFYSLQVAEIAMSLFEDIPQIPLEQCQSLLDDFWNKVKKYQTGERLWYQYAMTFYKYLDKEKAKEYYQKFLDTPRDMVSDCEACEQDSAVSFALYLEDYPQAMKLAQPILNGQLSCLDIPQQTYATLADNALNHGNLKEAKQWIPPLVQIARRNKGDLDYIGIMIRGLAYTDLPLGQRLLQEHIGWTIHLWNQNTLLSFDIGAWVLCHELGKQQDTVNFVFPKEFPLWQQNGQYKVSELENWFSKEAIDISLRFDKRNGTDYFMKRIHIVEDQTEKGMSE